MCGIAGIIARESETLGTDLMNMLKELAHRGKDATGVAIYERRETLDLRVSLADAKCKKDLEKILKRFGNILNSRMYRGEGIFYFYEASIDMSAERTRDLQ